MNDETKDTLGPVPIEKAKEFWESIPNPTIGAVVRLIKDAGYQTSVSTITRYKANDWRHISSQKGTKQQFQEDADEKDISEQRAVRKIIDQLPNDIFRSLVRRLFSVETLAQKKENAKKSIYDGLSASMFLFLRDGPVVLKNSPMAYAAIITAYSEAFRAITVPGQLDDTFGASARDVTGLTISADDKELRELLADTP